MVAFNELLFMSRLNKIVQAENVKFSYRPLYSSNFWTKCVSAILLLLLFLQPEGLFATCQTNVADDFSVDNYTSGTGTWASNWTEVNNGSSASDPDGDDAGLIQIVSGQLRFEGVSGNDPFLYREVDLSAATSVILSFDLSTSGNLEESGNTDRFGIWVSNDGGSNWNQIDEYIGDSENGAKTYDITEYASINTRIRFLVEAYVNGTDEYFFVDNVDITANCDICTGDYTMDFDTDDAGGTLTAGVTNVFVAQPYDNIFGGGQGIILSTDDQTNHPLNLYDSEGDSPNDPDLERNETGTGLWEGGNLTDHVLDNLLIINEDNVISDPDDEASGGQIILTSDIELRSISFDFVDLDAGGATTGSFIKFENTITGDTARVDFPDFEDGSGTVFETTDVQFGDRHGNRIIEISNSKLGIESFDKITFDLNGSGGIGDICIKTLLPWPTASCFGESIVKPGVAAVTCGVTNNIPVDEQWTFAILSLNGVIPASGRADNTNGDSVFHHRSWRIDSIGNVFGIATNQATQEIFITSSSNYGAGFGLNGNPSVLKYGAIGNPANDVVAAGTVYRIDPLTGQASVFARLPQQSVTLSHYDCEDDQIEITRNNSGVGLGNIDYDEAHNQYFVTNFEDGRIYRLDSVGTILDSYDPLTEDDGAAGSHIFNETPYGIAVEPGGNRLFFGLNHDAGFNDNGNGATGYANAGAPDIYSIDLNPDGSFVGTVDNSVLPSGVPNNYVGTETFHVEIPMGDGTTYTDHTSYFISDLDFDINGNLLVGTRIGCYTSFQSSYNHHSEMDLVALNNSNNLYDNTPVQLDVTVTGLAAAEDTYGGVAIYNENSGSCDINYATTSSDILNEAGPHGIAYWHADSMNSPISPLGAFSYGTPSDPKGIGGDIEIFSGCSVCNMTITAIPLGCDNQDSMDVQILVTNPNVCGTQYIVNDSLYSYGPFTYGVTDTIENLPLTGDSIIY